MSSDRKRSAGAFLACVFSLFLASVFLGAPALCAPGPTLTVERVEENSSLLAVTFTVENLFSPRIVETLERGLPATLSYEIQLWKSRRMWFDKLLWVNRLSYRMRYDPWEGAFLIETREGSSPAVFDLVHVENSLCSHVTGRLGSVGLLEPRATHYVVVRAAVKLLSPEDVNEVENWLSEGREGDGRGATAVPGYLFDMLVGLSGFRDEAASGRSRFFRLDNFE